MTEQKAGTLTIAEIETIEAYLAKIPQGPYFVGFDDAKECGPHANSGLALVDTGRESDWPIARLCEWPQAEAIAKGLRDLPRLCAELKRLLQPPASPEGEGLLPCANCGSTATEMQSNGRWWIECDNCGINTPADNFGDPVKRWNTRTLPAGYVAEGVVEGLVEALGAFVDYYTQAGIGDCLEEADDKDLPVFDGDERFNVRQARVAISAYQESRK